MWKITRAKVNFQYYKNGIKKVASYDPQKLKVTQYELNYDSIDWMWLRMTQNKWKKCASKPLLHSINLRLLFKLSKDCAQRNFSFNLDKLLDDGIQPDWTVEKISEQERERSHYWNYFLCIIGFPILWFFIYLSAEMMSINRHFEVVTLGKRCEEMQC